MEHEGDESIEKSLKSSVSGIMLNDIEEHFTTDQENNTNSRSKKTNM